MQHKYFSVVASTLVASTFIIAPLTLGACSDSVSETSPAFNPGEDAAPGDDTPDGKDAASGQDAGDEPDGGPLSGRDAAPPGDAGPGVLATGLGIGLQIDTDGTDVFVAHRSAAGIANVSRIPVAGGAVTPLVPGGFVYGGTVFVVGQDVVYSVASSELSTGNHTVYAIAKSGGTPRALGTDYHQISSFAADSANLYWAEAGDTGGIWRLPRPLNGTDKPAKIVSPVSDAATLKITGSKLLFTSRSVSGGVYTAPLAGGAQTQVASYFAVWGVDTDGTQAFYSSTGTFGNNFADGRILRAPLAGGSPVIMLTNQARQSHNIVYDTGNIYWGAGSSSRTAPDGHVWKIPATGGTPIRVSTVPSHPEWLVANGGYIYWCGTDGGVYRAPM